MSASESTEPKGKFFKAIVTSPHDLGKPKKPPQRTVPPLRHRRCLPVNRPSKLPQISPGPTGEATSSDASRASESSAEMFKRLDRVLDTSSGGAERCQDEVKHLTELLFIRNFTELLDRSEKLEDIAIIQTIFSANSKSNRHHDQELESLPTTNNLLGVKIDKNGTNSCEPVNSMETDPSQPIQSTNRTYSPLLVKGEKRGVLRFGKSPRTELEDKHNASKITRWHTGEQQRTMGVQQMRLPKLVTHSKGFRLDRCRKKDGISSEGECLKRSRCRLTSKSTGSAETADDTSRSSGVSYPCPRNLTIIQRRGNQTTTRVCSPMPALCKPLPPIRRRHHSDICTMCPEVHDWKGLARNPRWYPSKTETQHASKTEKELVIEPRGETNDTTEIPKEEVLIYSETGYGKEGPQDVQKEDLKDEDSCETSGSELEGDNWYPEKSIPDANDVPSNEAAMEPAEVNIRDTGVGKSNNHCNAVSNAHCPWLVDASLTNNQQSKADDYLNRNGTHTDFDKFSAGLLDMDFECNNKTEIELEDDETFRQAVLLRNQILNHGSASNAVDESLSSMAGSQDQPTIGREKKNSLTKRFEDIGVAFNAPVNGCESQFQEIYDSLKSKSVNGLNCSNGPQGLSIPKGEVTMSSKGQRKIVNSSLVTVGKGQSENQARSNDGVAPKKGSCVDVTKDDSSEMLLKREMNRYLHSLRHYNARERRHHSMSSAQNLPVKVQNLSAFRPIAADVLCSSVLTKAVGFIPILTRDEYASLSLCAKKTSGPMARIPRAAALPPIAGNPNEVLLVKRFDGEVKGKQLPWQKGKQSKK